MYQCKGMYKLNEETSVGCGKCDSCRALQTAHWQFRLMQEEKQSVNACFVTLTYDTKHLPFTPSGFPTLDKKAVPAFVKRVRSFTLRTDKQIKKFNAGESSKRPKVQNDWQTDLPSIKYYAVGEYGHKFKRPHYHLIMYNVHADAILNAWQLGQVHIGTVTGASIGYCLKYIRKRTWEGHFEGDDRQVIFTLQSKNLGVGYLTDAVRNYHQSPDNYHLTLEGKIIPMSRYYRDKLYTDQDKEYILDELNAKRVKHLKNITEETYYEKAFEAWAVGHATFNKPSIPNDLCGIISTSARRKVKPVKRHTAKVKPSQIKA